MDKITTKVNVMRCNEECCDGNHVHFDEIDEVMHPKLNYDPHVKYSQFNAKYFGGKLPDVPISWGKDRTRSGVVLYTTILQNGKPVGLKPETVKMVLSELYMRTEHDLDGILLHEMIHVAALVEGLYDEGHGSWFEKTRRELSAKVGFEVPRTDENSAALMTDAVKIRDFVVLTAERGGRTTFSVIAPNVLNDPKTQENMKRAAERMGIVYAAYKGPKTPEWIAFITNQRIAIQRSLKTSFSFREKEQHDALTAQLTEQLPLTFL